MKLACQDGLLPGATIAEKLDNAARCGFDGVELLGHGLLDRLDEVEAAFKGHSVKPTAICAGFRGTLLSPHKDQRELAYNDIRLLLEAAARLEMVGLIVVPIFGGPQVPDLSPWKDAVSIEHELLYPQWMELSEFAASLGTLLLLEPLNRYETHFMNRLEQGDAFIKRLEDSRGTKMLADFFHMAIEEADLAASFKDHLAEIGYVHLADSNRKQPGQGHTDFRTSFQVLKDGGYDGYMSLECGIVGDDRLKALSECVEFLREQM